MPPILAVNEIYGVTFQGEGKNIGMPCAFLRLAGCNLKCVWCDTKYTWDWEHYDSRKEIHPLTVDEVYKQIKAIPTSALVISGGEPLLQQKTLRLLTQRLLQEGYWVEIETAGTITPSTTELANQFNVSPKLANSGNLKGKRFNPLALKTLSICGRAVFKFVASHEGDLDEIDAIVKEFRMRPVYVMPEGTDAATLKQRLETLIPAILARGYYVTPRLHIELYGQRRGK